MPNISAAAAALTGRPGAQRKAMQAAASALCAAAAAPAVVAECSTSAAR